jgi:uncharacterized membrane protein YqaE (UPF0057 family)
MADPYSPIALLPERLASEPLRPARIGQTTLETRMADYDLDRRSGDYRPLDRRTATGSDGIRILCAILLPPLGVFLQVGLGLHFWLNILLTIFGYVPGIIHAVWIILRR